jgi:hypothetical protein
MNQTAPLFSLVSAYLTFYVMCLFAKMPAVESCKFQNNADCGLSFHRPLSSYYRYLEQDRDYICSKPEDNGMHLCSELPPYRHNGIECNGTALPFSNNYPTNSSCVNWNQYYTECKSQGNNPFQGAISFDNIGLAWVAIFLVSDKI